MKVFIGWSGERSKAAAQALHDAMKRCLKGVEPWVSFLDIGGGEDWNQQVREAVRACRFGVLCVTRMNQDTPWLTFEAGALSQAFSGDAKVCPYLIDLGADDLLSPLNSFQSRAAERGGTREMMESIVLECAIAERRTEDKIWEEGGFDRMWDGDPEHGWEGLGDRLQKIRSQPDFLKLFSRQDLHQGGFLEILNDARMSMDSSDFHGDLFVYNIELITLDKPGFWQFLIESPRIERLLMMVAPRVFRRLEEKLSQHSTLRDIFRNPKWSVLPLTPDPVTERLAFAYFRRRDGTSGVGRSHFCYLLPKIAPFAEHRSAAGMESWLFQRYLRTTNPGLLEPLAQYCRAADFDLGGLSMADMEQFIRGGPLEPEAVFSAHVLDNPPEGLLETDPYAVDEIPEHKLEWSKSNVRVRYRESRRELLILRAEGSTEPKPFLLWLPPWGTPKWTRSVGPLDKTLVERFHVVHVRYSEPARNYSFSRAEHDAAVAIRTLEAHAQELGVEMRGCIAGVSVNAYVAACVAARVEAELDVCMISPALDWFEALDSFWTVRGVDLFTRRFFATKASFRASGAHGVNIEYLGAKASPSHLLDLQIRGRDRCDERYLRTCLQRVLNGKGRVCVAHSHDDGMTPMAQVEKLCVELSNEAYREVKLVPVTWHHNLKVGSSGRWVINVPNNPFELAATGFDGVVSFLMEYSDESSTFWQ